MKRRPPKNSRVLTKRSGVQISAVAATGLRAPGSYVTSRELDSNPQPPCQESNVQTTEPRWPAMTYICGVKIEENERKTSRQVSSVSEGKKKTREKKIKTSLIALTTPPCVSTTEMLTLLRQQAGWNPSPDAIYPTSGQRRGETYGEAQPDFTSSF
ncbi:hypothetical protein ElyMa_003353700 [Elysia marginata]|uniref:Uncharacterized protein n=1 Tax=Elysia marginata TaxID=1093978 RepID=A0AAV4JI29_9GAST|nr:hypothetical protein ElyMa_003353700 [Elysia marginata]